MSDTKITKEDFYSEIFVRFSSIQINNNRTNPIILKYFVRVYCAKMSQIIDKKK